MYYKKSSLIVRIKKTSFCHFLFQVVDREDAKTERWLTWNDYGPDKRFDTKTLQSISKSLQNLEVEINLKCWIVSVKIRFC